MSRPREATPRVQINVRLTIDQRQELDAILAQTGEDQTAAIGRLVHEEAQRRGLGKSKETMNER